MLVYVSMVVRGCVLLCMLAYVGVSSCIFVHVCVRVTMCMFVYDCVCLRILVYVCVCVNVYVCL